jgi:hypothetical protein
MRTSAWSWSTVGTVSVDIGSTRTPLSASTQASAFYGVASTLLGDGRIQRDGPEAGLHERATTPEVCAYYARVLRERMLASGKVSFYPTCDYLEEAG